MVRLLTPTLALCLVASMAEGSTASPWDFTAIERTQFLHAASFSEATSPYPLFQQSWFDATHEIRRHSWLVAWLVTVFVGTGLWISKDR